jgi:hypothetical protein
MPKFTPSFVLLVALIIPLGCTSGDHTAGSSDGKMSVPSVEGGPEAGPDAGSSTEPDAGSSTEPDAGSSTEPDAGSSTEPDAGPDTEPDAGPGTELDAGPNTGRDAGPDGGPSGDASSCDSTQRIAESGALEAFAPFHQARKQWTEALGSATSSATKAPRPLLLGPGDPIAYEFWKSYVAAEVWAGIPNGYHPFGKPPSVALRGGEARLADFPSLVLGDDSPSALARLTDFSTAERTPRLSALCDAYLASAKEPEVAPLQALCREIGGIVRAGDVAKLTIDGIKLLRAKECGLPSSAYGAFLFVGDGTPPTYDWPDFLTRDPKYRQPCVGAYLHVRAEDGSQNVIGKGWLFVKAVADLAAVPFPYRERDHEFGEVAGRDGAPRGEFVSTRQLFSSGASLYLGTSPLWLLHRDELPDFAALVSALEGRAPACDLSLARPVTPCILSPQRPFLFPSDAPVAWLRQALDALNPGYEPGSPENRNLAERYSDTVVLDHTLVGVLRFFDTTRLDGLDRAALVHAAEQLGAVFHAFRLYAGRADLERLRTPMLPLADGFFLAVPDQGYFQVGTPTPEVLSKLESLDLTAALGVDRRSCSESLFTFNDLIPVE